MNRDGWKHWTENEISLLKIHWPSSNKELIQSLLPERTYEAIRIKAKELAIRRNIPAIRRFAKFVAYDSKTSCWNWTGTKIRKQYGTFKYDGKTVKAYRWIYEYCLDRIPDNMTIDHLCSNPSCVNPLHLKIASIRDNVLRGNCPPAKNARKSHCKNGHEFTEDNLVGNGSKRRCRICHNDYMKRRRSDKIQ